MDDPTRIHPPGRDGRKTARVASCDLPLRVVSPSDWPPARVLDVSRSGVRLGLAVRGPAVHEVFGLERLATQLHGPLTACVLVDLLSTSSATAIRRALRIVRIGPYDAAGGILEVGCTFLPPLGEPDVHALGLRLPREGETAHLIETRRALRGSERRDRDSKKPPGLRRLARCVRREDERKGRARSVYQGAAARAPSGLTVRVASCRRQAPVALCGFPLEFSGEGGFAALDTRETRPLLSKDAPVADHLVAFTRAYGEFVDCRVSAGADEVWTGTVRVVSVGILPEMPGRLVLGFTYCRPLVPAEMQALGLEATVSS